MSAPVEAAAEDGLYDQVIGRRRGADANAYVDLPNGRHVEVSDHEDLLLLVVHRRKVADGAIVRIPLDPAAHDSSEVVADFDARSKAPSLIDIRAMQGTPERRPSMSGAIPVSG